MNNQAVYQADYVERRSRLTTFFRLLLVIPHWIVLYFYGIAAAICALIAWFALVITARYPRALYDFVAGYVRYATAVLGYTLLLTDDYPPFSGDTGGYPVRLLVPPPQSHYSRLKAFFRFILVIPIAIVIYAMQIVYSFGAFIAWFAIVVLGRQPRPLQEMIDLGLGYQQRAYAYMYLLTEDWPPFSNEAPATLPGGGPSGTLTASPPAAPEAPTSSYAPPAADDR
jgi:hypothetical protein